MDEAEMRANFYMKFDAGLGFSVKSKEEYLERSRSEIRERDKAMTDFFKSLKPIAE